MPTKHKVMSVVVDEALEQRLMDYRELTGTKVSTSKMAGELLNLALDAEGIKRYGVIEFVGEDAERIMKLLGTDDPEEAAELAKLAITWGLEEEGLLSKQTEESLHNDTPFQEGAR